jgi:hypothetical protein
MTAQRPAFDIPSKNSRLHRPIGVGTTVALVPVLALIAAVYMDLRKEP